MEALTRLVSESLARHGFDRPLDYRRLQWSRWFRCESPHSLLFVPSKPGVFALAEEMMDLDHGATAASNASATVEERPFTTPDAKATVEERPFRAALPSRKDSGALAPVRMLAVAQFFETDDMAFVLDRMLSHQNAMRARLASGRYFIRFVVIEDESQRRSVCSALNQWIVSSTEKATGIGSHFATSLELTPQLEQSQKSTPDESVARTLLSATPATSTDDSTLSSRRIAASQHVGPDPLVRPAELTEPPFVIKPTAIAPTTPLNSGAATNIHCPFPSGF